MKVIGFIVEAEDHAAAGRGATALADAIREADGVLEVDRSKIDSDTMDLGAVVSVVATSAAALAIARGIAAWLKARRGVTIKIERDDKSQCLKASVVGLDPDAAVRIFEMIRKS